MTGTPNLFDASNDASNSLAHLAIQALQEANAGLTSRLKIAEAILLPVLRRVYQAPGLSADHTAAPNAPGVDLYDPVTRLGVQITADTSAEKVDHTLRVVAQRGPPLSRLVVALVSVHTPQHRPGPRARWAQAAAAAGFAFEPKDDIIAFDRLYPRIRRLDPEEITTVSRELKALVRGTPGGGEPPDRAPTPGETAARRLDELVLAATNAQWAVIADAQGRVDDADYRAMNRDLLHAARDSVNALRDYARTARVDLTPDLAQAADTATRLLDRSLGDLLVLPLPSNDRLRYEQRAQQTLSDQVSATRERIVGLVRDVCGTSAREGGL